MKKYGVYILLFGALCLMTVAVVALLFNIFERKQEAVHTFEKVVELDERTIDPEVWGRNFPKQYDGYKKTSQTYRTRYGGSEAVSKIDENPIWKRLFSGYAFGVDYREERGHAYSLSDQKMTLRTRDFKQPGACLNCHAGGIKAVYEEQGRGDIQKGFEKVCAMSIQEAWKLVEHPVVCADCHDPKTMQLRISRPSFVNGIKVLKQKEGIPDYDPNTMASHQEMRTYVCAQCHVEYYFKGDGKLLTYPWHDGLKVEEIEGYYDRVGHVDWKHRETGALMLKAQHPEFELWSQGTHAKSGVACADCHMPYMRVGASKITDHHIRSPLTNVSRACLQCHHFTEKEMLDRVELAQGRNKALLTRAEAALEGLMDEVVAAKKEGVGEEALKEALGLHRKAQWRLDFVSAENSMGFHAPQEAARILAEAVDLGRQGQLSAARARGAAAAAPARSARDEAAV